MPLREWLTLGLYVPSSLLCEYVWDHACSTRGVPRSADVFGVEVLR